MLFTILMFFSHSFMLSFTFSSIFPIYCRSWIIRDPLVSLLMFMYFSIVASFFLPNWGCHLGSCCIFWEKWKSSRKGSVESWRPRRTGILILYQYKTYNILWKWKKKERLKKGKRCVRIKLNHCKIKIENIEIYFYLKVKWQTSSHQSKFLVLRSWSMNPTRCRSTMMTPSSLPLAPSNPSTTTAGKSSSGICIFM